MESAALIGEALYDPEPDVREAAVQAMTGIAGDPPQTGYRLGSAIRSRGSGGTAVEALGEIGGENAQLPAAAGARRRRSRAVREAAARKCSSEPEFADSRGVS